MLIGSANLQEPLLKNPELVPVNVGESNTHPHVWDEERYPSLRGKRCPTVRDFYPDLGPFWRGVQHVKETSADAQVTGAGHQFCIG